MNKLIAYGQRLASLSLSLWLLFISALLMLFNSQLAHARPLLYNRLNTTPLWTWLVDTRYSDSLVFIAMLLLIAALGALALNTLACTISRLGDLTKRQTRGKRAATRFVSWAPTLMHMLFFLVLAGHMTTFSFGSWQVHRVRQGESLRFSASHAPLTIGAYSRRVRSENGPLMGSTITHRLEVTVEGRRAVIRELDPLKLPNGNWLLFLPPQLKGMKKQGEPGLPLDCSLEERHAGIIPFAPDQIITLKQVADPGVSFLFIGFGLILLLMAVHYAFIWRRT